MAKSLNSSWRFDWLQVSAVALVIVLGGSLMAMSNQYQSQAAGIYDIKKVPSVQVELANSQPTQIIQSEKQWLTRFIVSAESSDPIVISALTFSSQGTLGAQIVQLLERYPLTVTANGLELGRGTSWQLGDRITQIVTLYPSINLDVVHPLTIDVSTNLNNQAEQTFGVGLVDVVTTTPISLHGAPIEGRLFEIQERF